MNDIKTMNHAADNIRILTAAMVEKAKSGHPGGAMGGADFINVLYSEYLQYDPENPQWEGRDRLFLDPGHMSPMLYGVLSMTGHFTLEVYTDEPGIQVYTGNFLDGTVKGKKETVYQQRASVCLETQHYPDSPNKAHWPSVILEPGKTYQSHCIFKFGIEK